MLTAFDGEIFMLEADHHTTTDLIDKLGLSLQTLVGLFTFCLAAWALLAPEIALSLSLLAVLLVDAILGAIAVISNSLARSRALAFQDTISVMIHSNSLHIGQDRFDFPAGSIDDVLRQSNRLARGARDSAERMEVRMDGAAAPLASILWAVAGQFALVTLAAALGLYFSAEVKAGVEWFAAAVGSFR